MPFDSTAWNDLCGRKVVQLNTAQAAPFLEMQPIFKEVALQLSRLEVGPSNWRPAPTKRPYGPPSKGNKPRTDEGPQPKPKLKSVIIHPTDKILALELGELVEKVFYVKSLKNLEVKKFGSLGDVKSHTVAMEQVAILFVFIDEELSKDDLEAIEAASGVVSQFHRVISKTAVEAAVDVDNHHQLPDTDDLKAMHALGKLLLKEAQNAGRRPLLRRME
ncbi:hypothetical protein AAVH_13712 [Aphelenchoides avenae]|nr:hypothetical protein AAVH_13712 [Aphelenchus avenae]